MAPIEDFEKSLRGIVAAQRRPQPKLTRAEITAIIDTARPLFAAYEDLITTLRENVPQDGPDWYGYDSNGTEYTGDMKRDVTDQWKRDNGIPDDVTPLRATLGERGDGPRARGPVTFYTYPSPTAGIAALWVAKSSDLALLKGMVAAVVPNGDDEDMPEE